MSLIVKKIIWSIVPVFVLFVSIEMGLRATGWPQTTSRFEHNEPFWTVDPSIQNSKFSHKEENTHFYVSTNDDSLRAAAKNREKKDNAFRIMAMGCSTTFGWGVSDQQTYPSRLQEYAHQKGYNDIDVVNAGQPGYTSFQGRWLWNSTLQHYNADVVLLGFIVQDARKAAYADKSQAILQRDHRYLKNNVLYRSRVYLGLKSLLGTVQIRAKERGEGDEGGVYRVPPEDFADNIRALVTEVKTQGATPILMGYPLERSGYTQKHRIIMRAASETLDIAYFDLQPQMEKASREAQYYFAQDKGHANADGNDLIAQWVFSLLEENHLLGKTNG